MKQGPTLFFIGIAGVVIAAALFIVLKDKFLLFSTEYKNMLTAQVGPSPATNPPEALFWLIPASGSYKVNDTFTVSLKVNTSADITSVKAYLNYNTSVLSVSQITSSQSAFTIQWEEITNGGVVQLQRSHPFPGINGEDKLIAAITFLAVGDGSGTITYDSSSLALQPNDSNILNIAKSTAASFTVDSTPSVRTSLQPSGTLAAGTAATNISLTTNENATCKYSVTAGVQYDSMPNAFSTTGGTSHSKTVSGLANGTTYSYYVRCADIYGNKNSTDALIEFSVGNSSPVDTTSPARTNGQPSGTLAACTAATNISLTTNENATCKYSVTAGVQYDSMPNAFSTTGGTSHSKTVSGLANGTTYSYYVRCADIYGNKNSTDALIEFSVGNSSPVDTTSPARTTGQPS